MQPIEFTKMSGSGNDFIIIDNRDKKVHIGDVSKFVKKVCERKISVGADGLIFIERSDIADFKWTFFNSDGSVAEMCGNAGRCVSRYAFLSKIASDQLSFETLAGTIHAKVNANSVRIKMTDPFDLNVNFPLKINNETYLVSKVNTGVPHAVLYVDDVNKVDVTGLGQKIRFHSEFAPDGTNVNFISSGSDERYMIRTYERGVEDETLACGTGNVAAALILAKTLGKESPIEFTTRSGSLLRIYFKKESSEFKEVYLEGDARLIYEGELREDAW